MLSLADVGDAIQSVPASLPAELDYPVSTASTLLRRAEAALVADALGVERRP